MDFLLKHLIVNYQATVSFELTKETVGISEELENMKCILIFAILFTATWARPQRFQQFPIQQLPGNVFFPGNENINQGNNNNNAGSSTTTAAPSTATTASPQYLACLQRCPSTMEYNPICGTDNENYHNNGRLSCAQRCGKNVASLRAGTCNPL